MLQKKKGFTLIELLVVIAIIAILASIALLSLAPAQKAGRDARRIADLRNTQALLQLYYNKCGRFPVAGTNLDPNCADLASVGASEIAAAPSPNVPLPLLAGLIPVAFAGGHCGPGSPPSGMPCPPPGGYVGSGSWGQLDVALDTSGIITQDLPKDPLTSRAYNYGASTNGLSYVLSANLEADNSVLKSSIHVDTYGVDCSSDPWIYCVQF